MYFDQAKADRAINFIRGLTHTKGKWAGVRFTLLDWQAEVLTEVFGQMDDAGLRQYRQAYLEIPKKNGKSELAAAIALYCLCADGEKGAEVYCCAVDRRQASIVFDTAAAMVRNNKWLDPDRGGKCTIVESTKRIVFKPTGSFLQALSSDVATKHGLNPSAIIFDELHAQPNRKLWDVMTEGSQDAREQPLLFTITTAGDDPQRRSIGWEIHKLAKDIIDGVKRDPRFYAKIYAAPEDAPWDSIETARACNPSIGHTIREDTVLDAIEKARGRPTKERNYRWLRLNQWNKNTSGGFIPIEVWDRAIKQLPPELVLRNQYVSIGGLDMSSSIDLTSYVTLFVPLALDSPWYVKPLFWIPEDTMRAHEDSDKVPYQDWYNVGLMNVTPGNVLDYGYIRRIIEAEAERYGTREIGYDQRFAMQMAIELDAAGLEPVSVPQNAKHMTPALRKLEELVYKEQLHHAGNPVLRWNVANLEVKVFADQSVKPVKSSKTARIDGIVATAIAMYRAISHINDGQFEGKGVYTIEI